MAVVYQNPAGMAAPIGPFSHVASANAGLVAIAGQVALDEHGELVGPGDCERQTEQVFANILRGLEAAGVGPEHLLQMTSYLISADDVAAFYNVRERVFPQIFPSGYPPNTLVIVQALVKPEFLVEVQALAQRPGPPV